MKPFAQFNAEIETAKAALRAAAEENASTGIPHVIDGEQPRPKSSAEQLEDDTAATQRIMAARGIGYPDRPCYVSPSKPRTVTEVGARGTMTEADEWGSDPDGPQKSADYKAALDAYTAMFTLLLTELRKGK
jgi:hypothetical protein